MKKTAKDDKKLIEDKLKKVHLNLDDIQDVFNIDKKVKYKPLKDYETNYKVYQYISVQDIDIYICDATRMDEAQKKYRTAIPLVEYLNPENEELYEKFIEMVKKLDLFELSEIEEEQKEFKNKIPYEVKYKNNFIWDIYYSETENKYFMMFPNEEEKVESLFYLIKKKIIAEKKIAEKIYIPISGKEQSYSILRKTEIGDLENYLWFFTGEWPVIYEVFDKKGTKSIQILGSMPTYEKIKTTYKLEYTNREEAEEFYKMIKALFILQSNMEHEYEFKTALDNEGKIAFYFNHSQITYQNLPEFIKNEIKRKQDRIENQLGLNATEKEKLELLKETIEKKSAEYVLKEKQIVTFLECKKTFFGRISYFFKKKKNKVEIIDSINKEDKKNEEVEKFEIEEKKLYTIEDLLNVGEFLEEKEKEFKNLKMDIKASEIKRENLDSKIKNATLYINEIESHKKSIFDFWKFTNKDAISMLTESEEEKQEETEHTKIKRVFSFEDDIEELGKRMDEKQRIYYNEKETDAIFAIYQDVDSFNYLSKAKVLKKDEKEIQKILDNLKEQYKDNYEQIKEKDFDIFGSVVEDNTKIKTLNNAKHREIQKDVYRVLNINLDTELSEYEDIINNYKIILENLGKSIKSPYDMPVYKIGKNTIEDDKWEIMNLKPEVEIDKISEDDEEIILNKLNLKERMPLVFYTNIMFYDNKNKTLPLGMDLSTEVLLNLQKIKLKLISRIDFNVNVLVNEFENKIKNVQVYEYDIETEEE
ncbi:MAG: hypothetical protein J6M60_05490 [Clostridia bacterium]|nr:hypothetical protein [Clostridia bacterium]